MPRDTIMVGDPVHTAAEALLQAAHDFWKAKARAGAGSAVVWVEDTDGQVVIFTRGGMRDVLMDAIAKKDGEGSIRAVVEFVGKPCPATGGTCERPRICTDHGCVMETVDLSEAKARLEAMRAEVDDAK